MRRASHAARQCLKAASPSMDHPGVFSTLEEAHYEGWFIVRAKQYLAKANPFECALMARKYIQKKPQVF